MFGALTEKFQNLFDSFGKGKTITEKSISNVTVEVRNALLEADVNYNVATKFVNRVKELSLGEKVLKSLKPKDQFIKIIHDELIELMGKEEVSLNFKNKLSKILLAGLQGSGKTTTAIKLAYYLKGKGKKVLVAACDRQRPAAIDQLKALGEKYEIEIFSLDGEKNPRKVAKEALKYAESNSYTGLIIDTAGRLHLNSDLMDELEEIKKVVNPTDTIFVASATLGQESVKIAKKFNEKAEISGTILTMLDGNTRAGAAISIAEVIKKPLLFEGVGEKVDDFQIFNPESMADRILGMGDIINLTKKAEKHISDEETKKLEKKLKKSDFSYNDYLKQMKMIKKMGSMGSLMKMVPGMSSMKDIDFSDKELKKIESIILSMTNDEREEIVEFGYSRRKRVAYGSGVEINDVNRLVKGFTRIKQMMKKMLKNKKGFSKKMPNIDELKDQFGGMLWR